MKNPWVCIGLGIVLGIIFAPQIRKLPLVNKIPQV